MPSEGSAAVARFARQLGAMPATMLKRIQIEMQGVGEDVAADAKSNASWSTRIPGTIKAKASTPRGQSVRVQIKAGGPEAPHARPFEGIAGNSTFRHPVFGNRDNWVSQATRPFLMPAMNKNRDTLRKAIVTAVEDAASTAGWK